jgi:glycosyltransferase involved in cell wall biosynthesis
MCDELAKRALKYRRDGVFVLKDISLVDSAKDRVFNLRDIGLSEDDDPKVVMYIGNLENYQGIDLLLESFVKVTRVDDRVRLIVVGGAEQDVDRYRAKAMSLSIGSRCHFLGPRPVGDLGAYMRLADVLVSPRVRGTNTPMKIYSYLDSGVPVVVTNLRTHTQVVTNELAFIADATPEDFSAKILEAISDPDSAHAKSRAARAYVRREHSHEAFQSKVQELISYVEKHVRTPPNAVRSRWS